MKKEQAAKKDSEWEEKMDKKFSKIRENKSKAEGRKLEKLKK